MNIIYTYINICNMYTYNKYLYYILTQEFEKNWLINNTCTQKYCNVIDKFT